MNFLYILSKNSIFDLAFVLEEMGHSVTVIDQETFDPYDVTFSPAYKKIEQQLCESHFDAVFTYLFLPVISGLCEKHRVLYVSWIYDSPQISVFHPSILNSVNRIFVFDHCFFERMISMGIPHVYYLPMAANTSRINAMNIMDFEPEYEFEISFVGNLYNQNQYHKISHQLSDSTFSLLEKYMDRQCCDWSHLRSWPAIPDQQIEEFFRCDPQIQHNFKQFQFPANFYLGFSYINRRLAERERTQCLSMLSTRYPVDCFTGSDTSLYPDLNLVQFHSSVNYYTELGKVYRGSKINLNFTQPSIESGIPLKVYDIMAYGGFVLSNSQAEYNDLFSIGKDLVVFHDTSELMELTEYYLIHDDEREAIALHGYQTIQKRHTYIQRISEILRICAANPIV